MYPLWHSLQFPLRFVLRYLSQSRLRFVLRFVLQLQLQRRPQRRYALQHRFPPQLLKLPRLLIKKKWVWKVEPA